MKEYVFTIGCYKFLAIMTLSTMMKYYVSDLTVFVRSIINYQAHYAIC